MARQRVTHQRSCPQTVASFSHFSRLAYQLTTWNNLSPERADTKQIFRIIHLVRLLLTSGLLTSYGLRFETLNLVGRHKNQDLGLL